MECMERRRTAADTRSGLERGAGNPPQEELLLKALPVDLRRSARAAAVAAAAAAASAASAGTPDRKRGRRKFH